MDKKWRDNNTFYSKASIGFYECDCFSEAKASTILKRLTDFAGVDYADQGYGREYLLSRDMAFLVSRASLKILKPILSDQPLIFATYERGTKGPLFYRDLYITNETGELLAASKTAWLLCNPSTRKLLRPSALGKQIEGQWERQLDCGDTKRLSMPENSVFVGERAIRYSDLDSNGHVNNGVYADIACDFLPFELFEKCRISELFINFQREAKLGESMSIYTNINQNTATVTGKLNDADSFICEIHFTQR